jgi:hypothetical protein
LHLNSSPSYTTCDEHTDDGIISYAGATTSVQNDQDGHFYASELYDECDMSDTEWIDNTEQPSTPQPTTTSCSCTSESSVLFDKQLASQHSNATSFTDQLNGQLGVSTMQPAEHTLMLLKLKHSLTKEAVEDIAQMLNVVSGNKCM